MSRMKLRPTREPNTRGARLKKEPGRKKPRKSSIKRIEQLAKSTAEKLSSLIPDSLPSVQCGVKELLAMPGKIYGDFKNQVLKEIRARAAR